MSKKHPPADEGEWIQPKRKGFMLECCDCALVHRLNFRTYKGKIQFQAFRNNRSTGQIRRHEGISITRKN